MAIPDEDIIVIDNGTGYMKAGFARDNMPRFTFPSVVGRPTLRAEEALLDDVTIKDIMVGSEAIRNRAALELSFPLENGVIRNWEDMELVWGHLFGDLMKVDTEGKTVVLTEAPMNPQANKARMIATMFEKYNFGRLQIFTQALLTLFSQGLMDGVVLDSGDGVTHVVAVAHGYVLPHLTRRLDVAGRHITRHLTKLLLGRGYAFNRTSDVQTVAEMKERLCYVALDYKAEMRLAEETTVLMEKYELPDGRVISIGPERFQAAEALFRPELVDVESPGMSDLIWEVINRADVDLRPALYQGIVLSGGTTMYPGLPSRIEHDLRARYLAEIARGDAKRAARHKIEIRDPPGRKHAVFAGAAYMAGTFGARESFWVSKAQFAEEGAERIAARLSGIGLSAGGAAAGGGGR